MVHILKLQLMVIERMNMYYNYGINLDVKNADLLIEHNFQQLKQDWNVRGKSINELYNIMQKFCHKHDYENPNLF